jgi:hypothetical protein
MLSEHRSGGHPSVSPLDNDLILTDEGGPGGCGNVVFISRKSGSVIKKVSLPKYVDEVEASGRNPSRVCHHPVFDHSGRYLLANSLPGAEAVLNQIEILSNP